MTSVLVKSNFVGSFSPGLLIRLMSVERRLNRFCDCVGQLLSCESYPPAIDDGTNPPSTTQTYFAFAAEFVSRWTASRTFIVVAFGLTVTPQLSPLIGCSSVGSNTALITSELATDPAPNS